MKNQLNRRARELALAKHHRKSWTLLLECVEQAMATQRTKLNTHPKRVSECYRANSPDLLPPVGCPLLLSVGGYLVRAERMSHISSRKDRMDYLTSTGEIISGRFAWTYP